MIESSGITMIIVMIDNMNGNDADTLRILMYILVMWFFLASRSEGQGDEDHRREPPHLPPPQLLEDPPQSSHQRVSQTDRWKKSGSTALESYGSMGVVGMVPPDYLQATDLLNMHDFDMASAAEAPRGNRLPIDDIESNGSDGSDSEETPEDSRHSSRHEVSRDRMKHSHAMNTTDPSNGPQVTGSPPRGSEKENIHVSVDRNSSERASSQRSVPSGDPSDTSDIDKRINALQQFLDKAR